MIIGVLSNIASPATDIYRSIHPFSKLGYEVIVLEPNKALWYDLYKCDILVVSRPNGTQVQSIIEEFKRMGVGKKVIVDMDDNLHKVDKSNPSHGHFSIPPVQESVAKCLNAADYVIYSTPALQKFYEPYLTFDKNAAVIPNAVDLQLTPMREPKPTHPRVRVLWRGSEHHKKDLETIRPFWDSILNNERYELLMMGLQKHDVFTYFPNAIPEPWNPSPFSYWGVLANLNTDVAIFPLENNTFNQGKSNIFALEMLVNGVLPIAPIGFPEFDHPGVVLYEELTIDLLEKSISNVRRIDTIKQGQQWILDNRTLEKVNWKRKEIVESFMV